MNKLYRKIRNTKLCKWFRSPPMTEEKAIELVERNNKFLGKLGEEVDKLVKQMQDRNKPS